MKGNRQNQKEKERGRRESEVCERILDKTKGVFQGGWMSVLKSLPVSSNLVGHVWKFYRAGAAVCGSIYMQVVNVFGSY